jgi:hypothetical protein
MAPEPARTASRAASRNTFAHRVAAALIVAAVLAPAPAHALKVATWNVMGYENPGEGPGLPSAYITGRQANFRTVMAALDVDVLVCEEMNSQAATDSFRLNVLGNVAPGQWSGAWVNVQQGEGIGFFWKPAKVALSNITAQIIASGSRYTGVALVKPAGYTKNPAWFRIYAVHLKAGSAASDATQRDAEATGLRTIMNTVPTTVVGPHIVTLGDMNLYDGTEAAYVRLTESQANNTGRMFDYLNMPLPWHQNGTYSAVYTQCPCNSCSTTGQSGGGLDDRFDLVLTTSTMQDGTGLDYVPGSYTPFGNDGLHFNTDINAGGNSAVGTVVANALHDVADHLPVVITLQLPAKLSAASQVALGDAIVGGAPATGVPVANGAPVPAEALGYSLSASAGFTAPAGPFTALAGAAANLHAIGWDAGAVGTLAGTLTIASNDNDTTSKLVALSARVLDHAHPSLDSLVATTSGALDFGDHEAGAFTDGAVRVLNEGFGGLQARLLVTGASFSGDPRFSLPGVVDPVLIGATGVTWNVHFDAAGATPDSTYTGTLSFTTADESLPGATALTPVTVSLRARVTSGTGGVPGPTWSLRFLPPGPNPLHTGTSLGFELPAPAHVVLGIYDSGGRRVASLADGTFGAGRHALRWDARDDAGRAVPAGLYFVRVSTPGLRETRRVVVLP